MSKSFLRSMRHAGLISALAMAPCLAINAGVVSAETIQPNWRPHPRFPLPSHEPSPPPSWSTWKRPSGLVRLATITIMSSGVLMEPCQGP